jgi:hypothetical protein
MVVVDTNVIRTILSIRGEGQKTYRHLSAWLLAVAKVVNLNEMRSDLPKYSPRLIQQALYVFRSKSNRTAHGDRCAQRRCDDCPSKVCPFVETRRSPESRQSNER